MEIEFEDENLIVENLIENKINILREISTTNPIYLCSNIIYYSKISYT